MAALFFALVTGCRDRPGLVTGSLDGVMGTRLEVKVWTGGRSADRKAALAGIEDAFEQARRVERLMSPHDPASTVSRINAAGIDSAVEVDDWTYEVLEESLRVSRETSGAFDPSWAALSDLWDFGSEQPVPPDPVDVQARIGLVDHSRILVDGAARTVKLATAGMRIGLGGSAKGFALDMMARALRNRGLTSFICYAGGDLIVSGKPGHRPWRLGIQHPRDSFAIAATYELAGARAVVTSGDYERFYNYQGVRYHHILDPRTGFPVRGTMSVTLMAPTGLRADALCTGVFVLGPTRGMALVERLDDVEAVIIDDQGSFHVSSGMRGKLEITSTVEVDR